MKIKSILLSLSTCVLVASTSSLAADKKAKDAAPPAPEAEEPKDAYYESFSSGDVVPTPPPEGEPDTSAMDSDSRSPDEIVEAKMKEFEDLENPPSQYEFGLTGALEFPHVLNFGLESLINRKWGVSFDMGSISRNISGVDVGMKHYDIRLRYHPWQGSFFVGSAFGQHQLTGEKSRDIAFSYNSVAYTVPTTLKVTAKSNYVAPHVGWFSIWDTGFTMGFDLGVMIPVSPTSKAEATFTGLPAGAEEAIKSDPDYVKGLSDVEDASKAYTKKTLPFLTMIRVGWMI